ncbi:MAG: glutamate-ammonia-ligase adenylyltransferase [Pseudomonadota bacterium]
MSEDIALKPVIPGDADWASDAERLRQQLGVLPLWDSLDAGRQQGLICVCACSSFLLRILEQQSDILGLVWEQKPLAAYLEERTFSFGQADEAAFMRELRIFRNRFMALVTARDMLGIATLDEVLEALSSLADTMVADALRWLEAVMARGWPADAAPASIPPQLLVMGMGKLGAGELNFSSDIDLIFVYPEDGELPDRKKTSFAEYYTRLARGLVRLLDQVTGDGFVFRVDMRLRPFGDSGPLVVSMDAFEQYYQGQSRDWERYAMVKARVMTGGPAHVRQIERFLRPFVYRRYLDYRALGELRDLKSRITRELNRKDRGDNIKLGAGGIREIEFITQSFQLMRGGQLIQLQDRRLQHILRQLPALDLMSGETASCLLAAYRFLRLVENRLQQAQDQQTHILPVLPRDQSRLAAVLGFASWQAFSTCLAGHREQVQAVFAEVIRTGESDLAGTQASDLKVINGELHEQVREELDDFLHSRVVSQLAERARHDLDRVIASIFQLMDDVSPDIPRRPLLLALLAFLQSVARRGVYLTLLAEHPQVLRQLLRLAGASAWLMRQLTDMPILLDELLDPRVLYQPLERQDLELALGRQLVSLVDPEDEDRFTEALRRFKAAQVLRVAAIDILGVLPLMVVSDYLTDIAEVVLDAAMQRAWVMTASKHGLPPACGDSVARQSGFGVIAYGKFGGIELGYGSDLDLVFLYDAVSASQLTSGPRAITVAEFYARVARRVVAILSVPSLSGPIYEVDLRLRPSGNSGLLVSSLAAFHEYQMSQAWIWELQALVRARFISGDAHIADAFATIRQEALCRPRTLMDLRTEVREMREKMRASLDRSSESGFDLKQGPGGIADVEFIVQFGVLACASQHPDIVKWSDVVRLLQVLADNGFLARGDAQLLRDAFCAFRARGHHLVLQEKPVIIPVDEALMHRANVMRIWGSVMLDQAGGRCDPV